jgi:hypothetical protein
LSAQDLPAPAVRIAEVVATELRRTGRAGLVLASAPGPGSDLLARWLAPVARLRIPDKGAVADVAGALTAAGAPGATVEALAWRSVAEAMSEAEELLVLGSTNKTQILLDPGPLPARVLPLGDVWASWIRTHAGRAALPAVLTHVAPDQVEAAERALRDYLEGGVDPARAFGALGALGPPVRRALDASEHRRRGLLVPKLEEWTVGIDPAR